jgi:hypothetical protein
VLEDADAILFLECVVTVVTWGGEEERVDGKYGAQLGSRRANLSGEEEGEDEGGVPVGAGEGRWRRSLDLRRGEVAGLQLLHAQRFWGGRGEKERERERERVTGATGGDWGGRQWSRVRGSFIRCKHNFTHPFYDERCKTIGLFGAKQVYYISPLLDFFVFLFSFLCNKKIILFLCNRIGKFQKNHI